MPYQVTCPDCSAKLKSAQPVPAGRPLTCPQCKRVFTLSEPAPEIETQPIATTPAPTPSPAVLPPSAPPGRGHATPRRGSKAEIDEIDTADIVDAADFAPPSKAKAKRRDDDDDDRPRSRGRRNDDEDDRPRRSRGPQDDFAFDEDERPKSKRRRDEDEEDRPRSRRSRDEDDEDDRPRRRGRAEEDDRPKRGRAADDDEDRPRSKRRRDEDEDESPKARSRRAVDDEDDEESPKSRSRRVVDDEDQDDDQDDQPRSRRRKGKKSNKALLLALVGGGAAMVLLLGCILVNVFVDPLGLFGGGSSEMLAWAPADSQMIMFMDVEEMEKVNDQKGAFQGSITDSTKLGLKSEDVSSVMGAGKGGGLLGGLGGDPDVTIIKLRKDADQKKIIDTAGGTEATASGKKYYKTKSGSALYFASSKLVVVSKTESTMTALLQKDEGKVVISDDLRSVAKRADGMFWMASTGSAAEQADLIGMFANPLAMFKDLGGKGPKTAAPKCKSALMSMKASGNRATAKFESTYDSADSAKRMADDLKKAMDQMKNNKGSELESFDVSNSGATVTLTMVGPTNKNKGGLPGFPFGGGIK